MAKSPVFIAVNTDVLNASNLLKKNYSLPKHLQNFIFTLVDACQLQGISLKRNREEWLTIPRDTLRGQLKSKQLPCSEGLISTRLKELVKNKVLDYQEESNGAGKKLSMYYFNELESVFRFALNFNEQGKSTTQCARRTKTEVAVQRKLFISNTNIGFLEGDEIFADYYIEGLISGVLDTAMRISSSDRRDNISANYRFSLRDEMGGRWNEDIMINTSCLTEKGSSIMVLSDQRCIRALNTMFIEYIKKHYELRDNPDAKAIPNQFVFDIVDLCKQIGLKPSGANLDSTRKMLARLKDTVFSIDAHNSPWFQKKYGLGADKMEYRYIVQWYAKTESEELFVDGSGALVTRAERYYVIKFHDLVFNNLLSMAHVFISHPELRSEKSGIAHRFNNWCKAFIGVRPRAGKHQFEYQLDELKEKVMDSSRLDNFCRDFVSLLSRECISGDWAQQGKNVSLIYGYYVNYDAGEDAIEEYMARKKRGRRQGGKRYPVIIIERDTQDPIVGNDSRHNQALRQEMNEITHL
ncbi:MAG: hypothetical protein KTR20_05960 [Cellvibrionaceae bacterium]|nr:hypothetical protein [Cellvibrionaceae bacterium]